MIADGKKIRDAIADEIRAEIAARAHPLRLAIVLVGEDPRSLAFVRQKEKFAASVGIETRLYTFPADISATKLRSEVSKIVHIVQNDGVIVQLPLPAHIPPQNILNAVTPEKDVDMLSARSVGNFATGVSKIMPPVVGAVAAILYTYIPELSLKGKRAVVVGRGRLVGLPVGQWLMGAGASVSFVDEHTADIGIYTKQADIIISGAGVPGLLTGEMVRESAIVIDAGTTESQGKLLGDVDAVSVGPKAALVTPVPVGVGPVTVAKVFENLVVLHKK